MSLQGLISGSECAVPFNPLSQVLKHTEGDRSLQQDRTAGPSSSRLHHLPTTSTAPGSERDAALVRQFFEGHAQQPLAGPARPLAHQLPPDLAGPLNSVGPDLSNAWNEISDRPFMHRQHHEGPAPQAMSSGWSSEFSSTASMSAPQGPVQSAGPQRGDYVRSPYMSTGFYGGMAGGMMYQGMNTMGAPQILDSGKGKGKEIDFEAAFAQAAASFSEQGSSGRIVEVSDDVNSLADTLQETQIKEQEIKEASPEYGTDFQKVWGNLQHSDLPPPQEDVAKWEAQFNQLMSKQRDDNFDYGDSMLQAWEEGLGSYDFRFDSGRRFDDDGIPILEPYGFEKENKYLDPSTSSRSNLQAAKDLLEQNGSLSEVALLLEAAIQKGELGHGGYEAWILLGETRSMDEREEQAMRALMEGTRRAQEAGETGEGMLSLAISFTNESLERASHTMLLRWLHARFPSHEIPEAAWKSLSQSSWHSHEQVTDVFLGLAREQYSRGEMDPDVQIALGVLFYANSNFDRAKDCFEAALAVRPRDYLLWNRLGSSLSNDSKPEEALGAYREALQLRPTYTRAIYNVGVACLNIGAHKEAAEHLLSALAMQDMSGGAQSDQLWQTLRRVFVMMGRADLADQAKASTSVEIFRKEGFDF
ncbi:TPR-like protein, partial [Wolfiporia cocos MD-104 SS10]